MSTEIKDMMSSLVAVIQRAAPGLSQSRMNPPAPTIQTNPPAPTMQIKPPAPTAQVLQTPIKLLVKAEHVGTNYRHLVAQPGDYVIVYAWTNNEQTAIAYNARYDMAGQIPADLLDKDEPQPVMGSEICVSSQSYGGDGVGGLDWKAGDYLRICKFDNGHRNSGIGFNIATVKIGRFLVQVNSLKNIRPSDQL